MFDVGGGFFAFAQAPGFVGTDVEVGVGVAVGVEVRVDVGIGVEVAVGVAAVERPIWDLV